MPEGAGLCSRAAASTLQAMKISWGLGVAVVLIAGASANAERPFYRGADISALPVLERQGARFARAGREGDGLELLRAEGANAFRLRLFVNPRPHGIVDNSLDYTVALARRVKASGAAFMLDLHYSDTWADPAQQTKPAAWAGLAFEDLVAQVGAYTRAVLERFEREGLRPDFVQVGNEITNGFLWPEGRLSWTDGADHAAERARFVRLLQAGVAAVPRGPGQPQIVLHIESGADLEKSRTWLRTVLEAGIACDVLGLSYYPDWHGGLAAYRDTLAALTVEFGRPIMVVETAYPAHPQAFFDGKPGLDWPLTPEGQAEFLRDVVAAVRSLPGGSGRGVWYWHPESVPVEGIRAWHDGVCALFEAHGAMRPGATALFGGPAAEAGEPD